VLKFIQPNIEPITDRTYQLVNDWSYTWITNDIVNKITIPSGFRYDGASVPRPLWSLSGLRPDGLHRAGTLIHDFIYYHEGKLPIGVMKWRYLGDTNESYRNVSGKWTRKDADRLAYKVWRRSGQPHSKLMYYFVRVFGWFLWKD